MSGRGDDIGTGGWLEDVGTRAICCFDKYTSGI